MNYLAHFYLAKPTAASRAGNFLGDFITGTPESLKERLPEELVDGIMMHRRIDAFTDSHPSFQQGKSLLDSRRKRFAGIILDMFTDHFLAKEWEQFSPMSLTEFASEVEAQMQEYWEFFPENARWEASTMLEQNWFQRYETVDGIERSLTGISRSRARFDPIAESSEHLLTHYDEFKSLSFSLLADAQTTFKG